jgi:hypothetical protein
MLEYQNFESFCKAGGGACVLVGVIFTLVRTIEVNLILGITISTWFLKEEDGYYTYYYYCLGVEDVLNLLALVGLRPLGIRTLPFSVKL